MQALVRRIFKSDTQRPSAVQEWQMPHWAPLPIPPLLRRELPLEAQETSYLAPSARILSFSARVSSGMVTRYRMDMTQYVVLLYSPQQPPPDRQRQEGEGDADPHHEGHQGRVEAVVHGDDPGGDHGGHGRLEEGHLHDGAAPP